MKFRKLVTAHCEKMQFGNDTVPISAWRVGIVVAPVDCRVCCGKVNGATSNEDFLLSLSSLLRQSARNNDIVHRIRSFTLLVNCNNLRSFGILPVALRVSAITAKVLRCLFYPVYSAGNIFG